MSDQTSHTAEAGIVSHTRVPDGKSLEPCGDVETSRHTISVPCGGPHGLSSTEELYQSINSRPTSSTTKGEDVNILEVIARNPAQLVGIGSKETTITFSTSPDVQPPNTELQQCSMSEQTVNTAENESVNYPEDLTEISLDSFEGGDIIAEASFLPNVSPRGHSLDEELCKYTVAGQLDRLPGIENIIRHKAMNENCDDYIESGSLPNASPLCQILDQEQYQLSAGGPKGRTGVDNIQQQEAVSENAIDSGGNTCAEASIKFQTSPNVPSSKKDVYQCTVPVKSTITDATGNVNHSQSGGLQELNDRAYRGASTIPCPSPNGLKSLRTQEAITRNSQESFKDEHVPTETSSIHTASPTEGPYQCTISEQLTSTAKVGHINHPELSTVASQDSCGIGNVPTESSFMSMTSFPSSLLEAEVYQCSLTGKADVVPAENIKQLEPIRGGTRDSGGKVSAGNTTMVCDNPVVHSLHEEPYQCPRTELPTNKTGIENINQQEATGGNSHDSCGGDVHKEDISLPSLRLPVLTLGNELDTCTLSGQEDCTGGLGNTDQSVTSSGNCSVNTNQSDAWSGNAADSNTDQSEVNSGNPADSNTKHSKSRSGNPANSNTNQSEAWNGYPSDSNTDQSEARSGNPSDSNTNQSEAMSGNPSDSNTYQSEVSSGNPADSNTKHSESRKVNPADSNVNQSEAWNGYPSDLNTDQSEVSSGNPANSNTNQSEARSGSPSDSNTNQSEAVSGNPTDSNTDQSEAMCCNSADFNTSQSVARSCHPADSADNACSKTTSILSTSPNFPSTEQELYPHTTCEQADIAAPAERVNCPKLVSGDSQDPSRMPCTSITNMLKDGTSDLSPDNESLQEATSEPTNTAIGGERKCDGGFITTGKGQGSLDCGHVCSESNSMPGTGPLCPSSDEQLLGTVSDQMDSMPENIDHPLVTSGHTEEPNGSENIHTQTSSVSMAGPTGLSTDEVRQHPVSEEVSSTAGIENTHILDANMGNALDSFTDEKACTETNPLSPASPHCPPAADRMNQSTVSEKQTGNTNGGQIISATGEPVNWAAGGDEKDKHHEASCGNSQDSGGEHIHTETNHMLSASPPGPSATEAVSGETNSMAEDEPNTPQEMSSGHSLDSFADGMDLIDNFSLAPASQPGPSEDKALNHHTVPEQFNNPGVENVKHKESVRGNSQNSCGDGSVHTDTSPVPCDNPPSTSLDKEQTSTAIVENTNRLESMGRKPAGSVKSYSEIIPRSANISSEQKVDPCSISGLESTTAEVDDSHLPVAVRGNSFDSFTDGKACAEKERRSPAGQHGALASDDLYYDTESGQKGSIEAGVVTVSQCEPSQGSGVAEQILMDTSSMETTSQNIQSLDEHPYRDNTMPGQNKSSGSGVEDIGDIEEKRANPNLNSGNGKGFTETRTVFSWKISSEPCPLPTIEEHQCTLSGKSRSITVDESSKYNNTTYPNTEETPSDSSRSSNCQTSIEKQLHGTMPSELNNMTGVGQTSQLEASGDKSPGGDTVIKACSQINTTHTGSPQDLETSRDLSSEELFQCTVGTVEKGKVLAEDVATISVLFGATSQGSVLPQPAESIASKTNSISIVENNVKNLKYKEKTGAGTCTNTSGVKETLTNEQLVAEVLRQDAQVARMLSNDPRGVQTSSGDPRSYRRRFRRSTRQLVPVSKEIEAIWRKRDLTAKLSVDIERLNITLWKSKTVSISNHGPQAEGSVQLRLEAGFARTLSDVPEFTGDTESPRRSSPRSKAKNKGSVIEEQGGSCDILRQDAELARMLSDDLGELQAFAGDPGSWRRRSRRSTQPAASKGIAVPQEGKRDMVHKENEPSSSISESAKAKNRMLHRCDTCEKRFSCQKELQRHRLTHKKDRSYKCEFCERGFIHIGSLVVHKLTHKGATPYQCRVCDKGFASKTDLVNHLGMHEDEKPHKCSVCGKGFCQEKNLARHYSMHTDKKQKKIAIAGKPYQCTHCGAGYSQKRNLTRHLHIHDREHCCTVCDKLFINQLALDKHRLTHKDKKPHKCDVCGKEFSQKANLGRHWTMKHKGEKPLYCTICHKQFSTGKGFASHNRMHARKKPGLQPTSTVVKQHECPVCCKVFSRRDRMLAHMLTHKGVKKHKCSVCDKVFPRRDHLLRHMLTHKEANTHKCLVCCKTFSGINQLTSHMLSHKGKKPYRCTVCSSSFSKSSHLTLHNRIHTGEQPYSCNICDKRFTQNGSLHRHLRTHKRKTGDKGLPTEKKGLKIVKKGLHAGDKEPYTGKGLNTREKGLNTEEKGLDTGGPPFRCSSCGLSYSSKRNLTRHQLLHTGSKPYKCMQCDVSYSARSGLSRHLRLHKGDPSLLCSGCNKEFVDHSSLTAHQCTKKEVKPYSCTVCGLDFSQKPDLSEHYRIHKKEKPFQCFVCDKRLATAQALASHKRAHTRERPYECSVCLKVLYRKDHLNSHMLTHEGETSYKCSVCSKKFAIQSSLSLHMRSHTRKEPFQCNMCGKRFSMVRNLKRHKLTHVIDKPYKCFSCDASFGSFESLTRHKRLHSEGKSFKCEECGMSFAQASDLTVHRRIHAVEKPFGCDLCGNTYADAGSLTKHIRIHTGEKPYKCQFCEQSFSSSGERKLHERIHIEEETLSGVQREKALSTSSTLKACKGSHRDEKSFLCSVCGKGFSTKNGLASHKRSHRGIKHPLLLEKLSHTEDKRTPAEKIILHQGSSPSHHGDKRSLSKKMHYNSGEKYSHTREMLLYKGDKHLHSTEKFFHAGKKHLPTGHKHSHMRSSSHTGESHLQKHPHSREKHFHRKSSCSGDKRLLPREKRLHTEEKRLHCVGNLSHVGEKQAHSEDKHSHPRKKPHKCYLCGKRFSESVKLKIHYRLHTAEKPFKCSVCGKGFRAQHELKAHKETHIGTDEMPYKCDECGKQFSAQGHLFIHQRIHTGSKPFKCSVCEKSFICSNSLIAHQLVHKGEKPYKCSICDRGFTDASCLNNHLYIHKGNQPLTCNICDKKCKNHLDLKAHVDTH